MILKEGLDNHIYQVVKIELELKIERRLEALGLTPGTIITVLNNQKKGALIVKFRGTRFAIGKRIANHITVLEVIHE
ncbi:MAG: FeoA domain-containing protein [Lachnospiraceae bacterium]|nr:FeoA domain-containing protein [Lachnospiraceae bacterium]